MMKYDEPYSYLNLSVILSLELCNNFNSNVNERKKYRFWNEKISRATGSPKRLENKNRKSIIIIMGT